MKWSEHLTYEPIIITITRVPFGPERHHIK